MDPQHSFPPALFLQVAHPRAKQVFQRNDSGQLASAVYHRHARNARFRHAVDDNSQRFVRVGHHRILAHHFGELGGIAVSRKLPQISPRHYTR
jgi:hypothetical protein